eukprot:TRINITY_DN3923_c0_g2_i1.p1 TRINITY_DN3923_c0_g2~~TRINITY_DN3923_c0_g2_i1.p1  ORF type:complete len:260 (-),score=40.23 TRINITY_DN3923_c0_g2_i1:45-824(-)
MQAPLRILLITGAGCQVQNLDRFPAEFGFRELRHIDTSTIATADQLPTVADMFLYDVVLTYTDMGYGVTPEEGCCEYADVLGDRFADYLDAGGALVTCPCATKHNTGDVWCGIQGRFVYEQYFAVTPSTTVYSWAYPAFYDYDTDGVLQHPLLANATDEFEIPPSLIACVVQEDQTADTVVVARYMQSYLMLAYKQILSRPTQQHGAEGCCLFVNFQPSLEPGPPEERPFPMSDTVRFCCWRILANALRFAAVSATRNL